jgi:hypothetical protein
MSLAITAQAANTAPSSGAGKASPVALQAQLQRFQQQLSDCVNCASADTAQGKSDIQAIAARITELRQRIAQVDGAVRPAGAPATGTSATGASATGTSATGASLTGTSATGTSATGTSATGTSATGAPGASAAPAGRIDVFA